MQKLPNTSINIETLNWLLINQLYSGGEGIICRGFDDKSVFKVFADWNYRKKQFKEGRTIKPEEIQMADNKLEKIKLLYQKDPDYMVKPLSTLSCNGVLIGYEQTFDPNDFSFDQEGLPRNASVHFLDESMQALEYFKRQDMIYGDVSNSNLLINIKTGRVKFCDIDNMQVGNYKFDRTGASLTIYSVIRGLDEYADTYMHNLMALRVIAPPRVYKHEPAYHLVKEDYSQSLTEKGLETLESMHNIKDFNGNYLTPYIKRRRA